MKRLFYASPHSPKGGLTAQRSYRLAAGLTALAVVALCATSCNVTRTITTKSEYWQKADTSVIIQTKTIEQYDASKKDL